MTDFEEHLADRLSARGASTRITVTADAIKHDAARGPRRDVAAPWRPAFAVAAAAAIVVGGLTVVSSWRDDRPAPAAAPATAADPYGALPRRGPAVDEHWHIAYGIDMCGTWMELSGDLQDKNSLGELRNSDYVATGLHSHNDGIMHLHPFTPAGAGANATLGRWFANYDIELTDTGLTFGPDAGNAELRAAYAACGTTVTPAVTVWPDPDVPGTSVVVTSGIAGIPLGADGMAMAISFTDNPTTPSDLPPSVASFAETIEALVYSG